MIFQLKKNSDPHFNSIADDELSVCEEMVEYSDLYFSSNSFAKKMYVGINGIIIIIPLSADNLEEDKKEQKRCSQCLFDIKEVIGLNYYIYPIFTGKEKCFYASDMEEFLDIIEVGNPYEFADKLCKYTCENTTKPNEISKLINEIMDFEASEEDIPIKAALDTNTIYRVMEIVTYYEGNERPEDNIKYDEDGNQYVLREGSVYLGPIDTGLISKKKWFRVSEENPQKYVIAATFFGWAGIHKFLQGDISNFLLYLVTFGFLGILPAVDLLSMFSGNYSFKDVTYEETERGLKRNVERIYLKKAGFIGIGFICIFISLCLGYFLTRYGYINLLNCIMNFIGQTISSVTQAQL